MKRIKPTYPDLKTWRDDCEFTQDEAANFLGISRAQYCKLERRLTGTTGKRAGYIERRTGVPVDVLVGAA